MATRRQFIERLGRAAAGLAVMTGMPGCRSVMPEAMPTDEPPYDLVVIGTGFGGSMTSLSIAHQVESLYADPGKRLPGSTPRILLIERGTWWTTPVETVQDKPVNTRAFLLYKKQPTQEWTTLNDARGALDLLLRCRRTSRRPQGLYEFAPIGQRGLFGLENDGVSVLRASGVGGGSLVYSNITIRPPETIFEDERWPGGWAGVDATTKKNPTRETYYAFARNAIGYSVEYALKLRANTLPADPAEVDRLRVNTGLSSIITRSSRLRPSWEEVSDISGSDDRIKRIKIPSPPKTYAPELLDRARVFQTAIASLKPDSWGTVNLAINDIVPEGEDRPEIRPRNYCERQGRCNIGCLPGARHTLNKQLMRAVFGKFNAATFDPAAPTDPEPVLKSVRFEVRTLADVDLISRRLDGVYIITGRRHVFQTPDSPTEVPTSSTSNEPVNQQMETIPFSILAKRVIVAAGCLGTNELMLRCQAQAAATQGREGLPFLSQKLGYGFSANGDYLAFLEPTKERVSLTRGPVTTSFGHFNANASAANGFHNIEDQGVPRPLAAFAGYGVPLIQGLLRGHEALLRLPGTVFGLFSALHNVFGLHPRRKDPPKVREDLSGDRPEAEDEFTASMMCIAAQGKDAANGQFRLEGKRLRMARTDGKRFAEDPIYSLLRASLDRLAAELRPKNSNQKFVSPFTDLTDKAPVIGTSHPLGGCAMAKSANAGVVDEFGRVFRVEDPRRTADVYPGLYIADAAIIPTALGVNPSLTIAAVALRIADEIVKDWTR